MKVALGIPFWGDDEQRRKNYEWVKPYITQIYPWTKVIDTSVREDGSLYNDDGTHYKPSYTRGGARNTIVGRSMDCDVVVICDADTFPEKGPLLNAIMGAQTHGGLHFPHDAYVTLNRTGTQLIHMGIDPFGGLEQGYARRPVEYSDSRTDFGFGGVVVVRPDEWTQIGGSPELVGWGFEDVVYAVKSRTLLRPNTHHAGTIFHLWHPTECRVGSAQYTANINVCREYEAADGDAAAILELEEKYRGK